MIWKAAALLILAIFYAVYLGKMGMQKRQGIQTDQIARGKQRGRRFYVELVMKLATYSVVAVEVVSILIGRPAFPDGVRVVGIALGLCGDMVFLLAVRTMKDSWRAGIAERDETEMVTDGVYRLSRNPAFLGFDLVYLGILLIFFNWVLLAFSVVAMVMLHRQILQEEAFLPTVFGERYAAYRKAVCRYFGRKA